MFKTSYSELPLCDRWIKRYMLGFLARLLRVRSKITLHPHENETTEEARTKQSSGVTPNGDLKTRPFLADQEESTPFLNNPNRCKDIKHSDNFKASEILSPSETVTLNGTCLTSHEFQNVETTATTGTYATGNNSPRWNHSAHAIPIYSGSNNTFPRIISETVRSSRSTLNYKTERPPPVQQTSTGTRFMPTHAYPKQVLKKSTSQSIGRIRSRSSTPVSVIPQENDTIARKRQSLILMNAVTRTADYSDDTQVSGCTQMSGEPSLFSAVDNGCSSDSPTHLIGQGSSFHFGRKKTSSKGICHDENTKTG